MTIQKSYERTKGTLAEVEHEMSCIKWKIGYYERIIKNAWWVLTDIESQDLNDKIYTRLVIDSLAEVANEVMDKEDTNDK